jgi:hypothetical protein
LGRTAGVRPRKGIAANLHVAVRRAHEIRLVLQIANAAGIVVAVVVDAEGHHHDLGLDLVPHPLHQQELLIGSVAGRAGIDDAVLRQSLLQQVGETFIELGLVAPGEGVPEEEDSVGRDLAQLPLAKSDAVVLGRNGAVRGY